MQTPGARSTQSFIRSATQSRCTEEQTEWRALDIFVHHTEARLWMMTYISGSSASLKTVTFAGADEQNEKTSSSWPRLQLIHDETTDDLYVHEWDYYSTYISRQRIYSYDRATWTKTLLATFYYNKWMTPEAQSFTCERLAVDPTNEYIFWAMKHDVRYEDVDGDYDGLQLAVYSVNYDGSSRALIYYEPLDETTMIGAPKVVADPDNSRLFLACPAQGIMEITYAGAATVIISPFTTSYAYFAFDYDKTNAKCYWAREDSGTWYINRCDDDGSNPTTITTTTDPLAISEVAAAPGSGYLFWLENHGYYKKRVMRCDYNGANVTEITSNF